MVRPGAARPLATGARCAGESERWAMMSRSEVAEKIRARENFVASNMYGTSGGGLSRDHQLPSGVLADYTAVLDAGQVQYTVYSYFTPVAWVLADGTVVVPDAVYFSKTTRRHRNLAREALGTAGHAVAGRDGHG